jgi:hypothetical protein
MSLDRDSVSIAMPNKSQQERQRKTWRGMRHVIKKASGVFTQSSHKNPLGKGKNKHNQSV